MFTAAMREYQSENIFNFLFEVCVKFIRKDLYVGKIWAMQI